MTKQQLAQKVASGTGLSGSAATGAVDATFEAIAAELVGGGDVAVAGFGKFSVSERSAREGPQSGDRRDDPDRGEHRGEVRASHRAEEDAE